MRAIAVFPKTRSVELTDLPEPSLSGPGQVKLRVLTVGICGTDREIWRFDYGSPPPGLDRLVTGHECLAEVVETAPDVTTVKPGDLVVPTVRRGCPDNCPSCAALTPDFCFTGRFTERGIKESDGFMTEFAIEDARHLTVLPRELEDVGVLLEPLTITEKALMQMFLIQTRLPWECRIEPGRAPSENDRSCRNVIVLGAGPVGLLAAMAFRTLDMKTFVVARSEAPNPNAAIVEAIGARYFATARWTPERIAREMGAVDVILEATGAAQVSFDFLAELGVNGIYVFTGVPGPHGDIRIDGNALMRTIVLKNQAVVGTVNAPKKAFENGVRDLLEFRRRWPGQLSAIITNRYRLDDLAGILNDGAGVKGVIDVGRR